jgi:glyoxylate reductase
MTPRVLITHPLPLSPQAMAELCAGFEVRVGPGEGPMPRAELLAAVADLDGVVTLLSDRVDAELLEAAPRLKVVANYAVGYDNVDLEACQRRGIVVTNTPDVLTEATADLTWALLLGAARRLGEGERILRAGAWPGWSPSFHLGHDVFGQTLGIIGMGRIGKAVARRALGFEMRILYTEERPLCEEEEQTLGAHRVDLVELLRQSDFVTLHCPLTPATRGLLGEAELAQMKPTAVLVNTARGGIVDERALARALREGRLAAAGLDVYEGEPRVRRELLTAPNALLAPHIGSATHTARRRMAEVALENLRAVLTGREPRNRVV